MEATVHWPYARTFSEQYPAVRANPERALVVAGARGELVSSGASTSWHDLVLYLIGREVGPVAAQAVSKFFALQRHVDGLAPFIVFDPPRGHGDALVATAQAWLDHNASVATPVRKMIRLSGLSERGFSRRFQTATGHAPLDYVQRLRVEQAKRRLERTDEPIEEIAWRVGYEDPSAFRRLFSGSPASLRVNTDGSSHCRCSTDSLPDHGRFWHRGLHEPGVASDVAGAGHREGDPRWATAGGDAAGGLLVGFSGGMGRAASPSKPKQERKLRSSVGGECPPGTGESYAHHHDLRRVCRT